VPNFQLERMACMDRRSAARECSAPRGPVQSAVQLQRYASGNTSCRTKAALVIYTALP